MLRRWWPGQGDRRIGRETGIDRKTVARYARAAVRLGVELTDEVVHSLAECVQSRSTATTTEEWIDVAQDSERSAH